MDTNEYIKKRRLENYSWRILSKISQDEMRDADIYKTFRSISTVHHSASMDTLNMKEKKTPPLRRARYDGFDALNL